MRWVLLGGALVGIVAVLVIGTDYGAFLVRRGVFYSPPTRAPGATPLRLTPPATQGPLVLSKYTIGGDYCVRYEIRATLQSSCSSTVIGRSACYDVARVGEPLPEGCR